MLQVREHLGVLVDRLLLHEKDKWDLFLKSEIQK